MAVPVEYLKPGQGVPNEKGPWLIIEQSESGLWYGSGEGVSETGKPVSYLSLTDSDVSLSAALAAAQDWASRRQVPIIYVQQASDA